MPQNVDLQEISCQIIGCTMEQALKIYPNIREAKIDGIPQMLTMDMNPNRINVETEKGIITLVKKIG